MCTTHEGERDGHLLAWLAARPEPWLLFRVMEQTAIEQSGAAAAYVVSHGWPVT